MAELLDLPASLPHRPAPTRAAACIQGSASEATLVAILAARWRATGGAVNRDGDTSRLVAYATAQAHSSIEKGLRIAGIGTDRDPRRRPRRRVRHATRRARRGDRRRPGRRAGAVLRVRHPRHDVVDGVRPDRRHRRRRAGAGAVAARRRGDERDRRARARAALGQRRRSSAADSYCTNPHKWMGINFDCDLFWTADRDVAARRAEHPARVPALGGGRARRGDRLPRLAGARSAAGSGRSSCGSALRLDGVEHVPGDDPPARRRSPRSWPDGSPPTTASRSSPRTRSTWCACGSRDDDATEALIEAANATRPGAVHPHRARRPPGAARLDRRPHHRSAATSRPPGRCCSASAAPSSGRVAQPSTRTPTRRERGRRARTRWRPTPSRRRARRSAARGRPAARPTARRGTCRRARARAAAPTAPARPRSTPGRAGAGSRSRATTGTM